MPQITTIATYDANGNVIKQTEARSRAARISVRARQWQDQLDSMHTPDAKTGRIGTVEFTFNAEGKSRAQIKF